MHRPLRLSRLVPALRPQAPTAPDGIRVADRPVDELSGGQRQRVWIVMKDGMIVAEGPAADAVTEEMVTEVFGMPCRVVPDPVSGTPMVVPIGRDHTSSATFSGTSGSDTVSLP